MVPGLHSKAAPRLYLQGYITAFEGHGHFGLCDPFLHKSIYKNCILQWHWYKDKYILNIVFDLKVCFSSDFKIN